MDSYSVASAQTTQSTNTSDSAYPILFQFQASTISETKDVTTNTSLDSPYVRRKSTVQTQLMKRVRIGLALVGILSIVMVIFVLSFYLPEPQKLPENYYKQDRVTIDSLQVDLNLFQIIANNSLTNTSLQMLTNVSSGKGSKLLIIKQTSFSIFGKCGSAFFNISLLLSQNNVKCWDFSYSSTDRDQIEHCVLFKDAKWYGIGERIYQTWLLNDANVTMSPFTTYDIVQGKENKSYGGVIEPYIIGSSGFGIFVDRKNPISMSINNPTEGTLCFKLTPSYRKSKEDYLNFTTCMAENVLEVHKYMIGKFFGKTRQVPDERMLVSPIWSTWAKYKKEITQEKVLEFAYQIANYSMPISQLEIDDKYSSYYGDFDFDPAKFKNPKQMIEELHSKGMRVTIWVYPFANFDSKAIKEGLHYWVQVDHVPGIVIWWNGLGAVLDVTNVKGVEWFKKRLQSFKDKYGFDGFKFDAGEVKYLPKFFTLNTTLENINFFSSKYVELASSFGGLSEVRVGYGNQNCRLFTRLLDRSSKWDIDNGLKSVLTASLTFGILGYPFILPDMVGGNAYKGIPDKELYIRWTQLNAFLPSIQFSLAPWDYDNETIYLVKAALDVRNNISADLLNFARIAANSSYPIIRPLWWLAPGDKTALINDSEFLLGDKYLIAPILAKGAKILNVYLVYGKWQEMFGAKKVYDVGQAGRSLVYNVKLSDIIYFKRVA